MNAFNKLISTLPVLTTDEEVLGLLVWNGALEEAAKAADAEAEEAAEDIRNVPSDIGTAHMQTIELTARRIARAIRSMQTTAGAAATPAPAAERGER